MKLTIEATQLLRSLVFLSRTEGSPDSLENPSQTRKARLLEFRMKLVQALNSRGLDNSAEDSGSSGA
jgi:hypothetical protein